jgi:hypothetical protein
MRDGPLSREQEEYEEEVVVERAGALGLQFDESDDDMRDGAHTPALALHCNAARGALVHCLPALLSSIFYDLRLQNVSLLVLQRRGPC